jgi:amino acid transporter
VAAMYISSLFSLVCIALSAPLCCCVLIEDYATVANADNFLHSRSKPRFFGSTFDYVHVSIHQPMCMVVTFAVLCIVWILCIALYILVPFFRQCVLNMYVCMHA